MVKMKKFGIFVAILVVLAILGGGTFLAFWDMPIERTLVKEEISHGRLSK